MASVAERKGRVVALDSGSAPMLFSRVHLKSFRDPDAEGLLVSTEGEFHALGHAAFLNNPESDWGAIDGSA